MSEDIQPCGWQEAGVQDSARPRSTSQSVQLQPHKRHDHGHRDQGGWYHDQASDVRSRAIRRLLNIVHRTIGPSINRPGCLIEVWLRGRLDPESSRYATIPEVGERVCLAVQDFAMEDLGREPLKDEAWGEGSAAAGDEPDEATGCDTDTI